MEARKDRKVEHASRLEWEAKRQHEPTELHLLCDEWWFENCDCGGECGCHWIVIR